MRDRLVQTLRRRERMLHIRQLQEDQAQQRLAVLLREEEALKEEQEALEAARLQARVRLGEDLQQPNKTVPSEQLLLYLRQMETAEALQQRIQEQIDALQPEIQRRRQEVVRCHKQRRMMEVLTNKTRNQLREEMQRLEQRELDDLVAQRFAQR